MSFRGSMPPGQPFHGQPQQQQQQQHNQAYMSYQSQQQAQHAQHLQHQEAQRFHGDGGGAAVGYQQFYDGQPAQYLQQQTQQPQRQVQSQQAMQATGYGAQGLSQFPGYDAMGYNPYAQQPQAAQYMPPPNVWQQQQQQQQQQQHQAHQAHQAQQTQHYSQQHMQHQQMQQVNQQRMAAVRASPVQRFDQLPQPQAHTHQAQHHPHHYPPSQQQQQPPVQQHHAQFPHQPSPSPSPSPRFPSQMMPVPPSHQSMSSPSAQHMPHPQQHVTPTSQYHHSPAQPSPKTVPAPRPKKKTPAPSPRQHSAQHPTPPPPKQTHVPASNGHTQQSPLPTESPVHPPQPIQPAAHLPPTHSQPPPEPEPEPEPQPQIQPDPPVLQQEPSFESFQFVNLQDIQQLPPLPPLPFDDFSSLSQPEQKEQKEEPALAEPMAIDAPPPVVEDSRESIVVKPKQEPSDTVQIKASPRSSVAPSPALSARSIGSISKKSPSMSSKARPGQSTSMLIAVAEEMLAKARASAHDVAMSLQSERVEEYQTLISVSVGCLESALHAGRLTPRQEARLRLRYATVLHEETENVMECETTLSKGITLCDNHRLHDLKYSSQYLLLKVLFHRNRRAALKALDNHISDCETFKHTNWYYAFRLLKASLCMEAGTAADASALDNLRALQTAASSRGDNALCVFASLLEGLTFLKAAKDGANERVQACLAQVAKYQLDDSVHIPQIGILTLLLDVASNLHTSQPEVTAEKLRNLQKRFDECTEWGEVKSEFLIGIRKSSTSGKTVSADTSMVLRDDENDPSSDYLVMTFMTKVELTSLVFTIGGLANFLRPDKEGHKTTGLWQEGLKILEGWDDTTAGIPYGVPISLPVAIRQRQWRLDAQCYLNTVLGLTAASRCQWDAVKYHLSKLEQLSSTEQNTLDLFTRYLQGVYSQGVGDLRGALSIFQDGVFQLPEVLSGTQSARCELSLLAALNRLWIMQHPSCRNDEITLQLVEELRPICSAHPHLNLRSTWQTVMAALVTDPPQSLSSRKQNMYAAMQGAKIASNMLLSAIGLCIMRHHFFEDIVGEQALKSARAAAKQAQRSGNTLWESVADGMLAHSYETGGFREEARMEHEKGAAKAAAAFSRSY